MPTIKIQLRNQDATEIKADVVLFGNKNPLKGMFEKCQSKQFEKITYDLGLFENRQVTFEMLELENHNWQRAVAIHYKSRNSIYNKLILNVSDILTYNLHYYQPDSMMFLPFSWRYPENVAFCTLHALWSISYSFTFLKPPEILKEYFLIADISNSLIIIADLVSTDTYKEYFKNDCEKLWYFIDKQIDKEIKINPWLKDHWKKIKKNKSLVQFQVIE